MRHVMLTAAVLALGATMLSTRAAGQARTTQLDATVQAFLDHHRGTWHDLNVPESDGKLLHDLIVEHKFTRALEIGTSTGHSGVWIAWALAKTGGKLTTVEIDPGRHRTALANANYVGGDINGGAATFRQLFARPVSLLAPYATPNPRLFLCSASTPPGGGVHGMCGYFAARSALRRRG
jgi:O-methyltransferase